MQRWPVAVRIIIAVISIEIARLISEGWFTNVIAQHVLARVPGGMQGLISNAFFSGAHFTMMGLTFVILLVDRPARLNFLRWHFGAAAVLLVFSSLWMVALVQKIGGDHNGIFWKLFWASTYGSGLAFAWARGQLAHHQAARAAVIGFLCTLAFIVAWAQVVGDTYTIELRWKVWLLNAATTLYQTLLVAWLQHSGRKFAHREFSETPPIIKAVDSHLNPP